MNALALLGSGRTADVIALDDDRVLRRYRDGCDVAVEAATMVHVAAHGFPVPRVLQARATDLVMERVHGPTMLAALTAGEIPVEDAGRVLADLLGRLHAVPPMAGGAPGTRVLHLDLHPGNVLLSPHGPVVIDWRNTTGGPPALDVAMSAVILAQAAATEPAQAFRAAARTMVAALLAAVDVDPLPSLDAAVARRASDPHLSPREVTALGTARATVLELRPT